MAAHNKGLTSGTRDRAIDLLGSGLSAEIVSNALGVDPSRISQLLAEEDFAFEVAEKRFKTLQQHNVRDGKYDKMEDALLNQLENLLPLMYKPMEVVRALTAVNAAKRRGQSSPDSIVNQNAVVNLTLPSVTIQKFTTNINNQVVKAGDQSLVTVQSRSLVDKLKGSKGEEQPIIEGEVTNNPNGVGTHGNSNDEQQELSEGLQKLRERLAAGSSRTAGA